MSPAPGVQKLVLIVAVIAVAVWWMWTRERDEREEVKHGFDAKERERLQQIVKANMDDPYQRAFKRMAGIRTGVEKWVGLQRERSE